MSNRTVLHLVMPIVLIAVAGSVYSAGRTAPDGAALRAASEVSVDSLDAMIRLLSIDPATGGARNRFTLREAELAVVSDTLADRLARYTGQTVERQSFTVSDEYYSPDTYTAENLLVRVPGTGDDSNVLIICAHYDAIGTRTEGWDEHWDADTATAPGANDNATGVAAVMEAARILSDYTLPFDLLFVLFSGEELGRLGSIDFVDRCDPSCAEKIIGVLNLDMIGYSADGSAAGSILSDYASGWIADLIEEAHPRIDPELSMRIIKPGPSNWDHASFWLHTWGEGERLHIPAITFTETLQGAGFIRYPYYHSEEDIIDWIDLEQTERITRLCVGFTAGFADRPPEMAILPSDVLLTSETTLIVSESFDIGEPVAVSIRCRNTGGEDAPVQTSIMLNATLENAGGMRTLFNGPLDPPAPLQAAETTIRFTPSAGDAGENRLRARIDVEGFDDEDHNNGVETRFVVAGDDADILVGHNFRPNPITGDFRDAELCVNLDADANIQIDIYTIEGEHVGVGRIGSGYGMPLHTGENCVVCGELFPGVADLSSGVYLYRLKVYDLERRSNTYTGRFAIVN